MIIEVVVAAPLATNGYLIGCEKTGKAIIIDPGFQTKKKFFHLIEKHGLSVEAIYLTHSHFDHMAGVFSMKEEKGWKVFVHEEDKGNLQNPGSDGIPNFLRISGVQPDGFFEDGEKRFIGEITCIVMHTPGHSPGSVVFYFPLEKALFSGDTLFKGTYGRVDLPTSLPEKMQSSLEKIKLLPDDVVVYPGHGEKTTLQKEKKWL